MCDYSLMAIPNRLAREGEELVTHRFESGTMGMASSSDLQRKSDPQPPGPKTFWSNVTGALAPRERDPVPAVCIPPGARLLLQDIPERLQCQVGSGSVKKVVFTQVTAAAHRHRDALRFPNGREILLQELSEGQRVLVLDLCSAPHDSIDQLVLHGG